jgi:LPXTG-site transpeptidase (sortase) family protein
MKRALAWIERGLLAGGAALAIWCAVEMTEASRINRTTIPAPAHRQSDGATALARRTVEAGAWLGRLEAHDVRLSATVLEGTADSILARAAGHIEETALPGEPGNIGIAGHRDTTFRAVRHLHAGESLVLTTADRVYRYRIARTSIVDPGDVYVLDPTVRPTLTLVTCYPFTFIGHAPRRFIVQADLVEESARIQN